MVIMHLTSKKKAPMYGEIGLSRIRKIVEYAKKLDMKVAFENTKIKGYLEYVINNIKDEVRLKIWGEPLLRENNL